MFRVNCITGALTVLLLGEQGSIGKLPEQAVQFLAQEGGVFVDPPLLPLLIILPWFILVTVACPVAAMTAALGTKSTRQWRRLETAKLQGKGGVARIRHAARLAHVVRNARRWNGYVRLFPKEALAPDYHTYGDGGRSPTDWHRRRISGHRATASRQKLSGLVWHSLASSLPLNKGYKHEHQQARQANRLLAHFLRFSRFASWRGVYD